MKLLLNKNFFTANNAKTLKEFRNNLKDAVTVVTTAGCFTEDHVIKGSKGTFTVRTFINEDKAYVGHVMAFFAILSSDDSFDYGGKVAEFYRNHGDYYGSNALVTIGGLKGDVYNFEDIRYTMNTLESVLDNYEGRDRGVR